MSNLKIGNLELDSQVILAPMAGVTNSAFKEVVRELGAGLVCTEMINDKALLHGNENTRKMVNISSLERPVSVQIFSNEVDTLIKAAQEIDQLENVDIIDINMGCPAPKITKNNSGSKILLYPELLYDMIKGVVDHVNKPVTVKMRIGWDEEHINVIENAKLAEKAGASAIIVHGRTTKQQYMGEANWDNSRLNPINPVAYTPAGVKNKLIPATNIIQPILIINNFFNSLNALSFIYLFSY